MDKDNAILFQTRKELEDALTDLLWDGARKLIAHTVQIEMDEFLSNDIYLGQVPPAYLNLMAKFD